MNERVQKTVTVVKEFWGRQSKLRKGIYIGGLALVVIVAVVAAALLNKKEYVVLYEGLETNEAAEIVKIIEEAGYECTLKSGGTITVPKGTEGTLAMTLAMQKYPRSNMDYSIYMEKVGMFTTESEKREYARISAENRLSAILASFEGVRDAEVTLTIPERKNTVIETYRQEPQASAVIYLIDGVELSNEQIAGMTLVIARMGIKDENITLVDGYGVPLVPKDIPVDTISEEIRRLRLKRDIEDHMEQKINALLSPAWGDGGFSTAVHIALNFDSKVSEDTRYTPSTDDGRGMLQHTDAEQASGDRVVNGGVQGIEVNAEDTYPEGVTGNTGAWTDNSVSNTYLVNTYKEQMEKLGAVVDDVSISVIIFTDYLPDDTQQALVKAVGNAGGVNPQVIPDVVSVMALRKSEDVLPAESKTFLFGLTLDQLVLLGAILLGILLILIIILAAMSSKTKKKRRAFERTLLEQNALPEGEPLVDSFFALSDDGSQPMDIPSLITDEGVETKEMLIRRELSEFAQHSPEIVAQLLRNWIHENEELQAANKKKKNSAPAEG